MATAVMGIYVSSDVLKESPLIAAVSERVREDVESAIKYPYVKRLSSDSYQEWLKKDGIRILILNAENKMPALDTFLMNFGNSIPEVHFGRIDGIEDSEAGIRIFMNGKLFRNVSRPNYEWKKFEIKDFQTEDEIEESIVYLLEYFHWLNLKKVPNRANYVYSGEFPT